MSELVEKFDPVSKPEHYAKGSLECIDWIRAALTPEEYRGYLKGCILKYHWRHEDKGNPIQDLEKLRQYAQFLIDEIERENVEKDILEENLRAAEWVQKRREEREEVVSCQIQKLRQYASFLIDQIEREELENIRAAEWLQNRKDERGEVTPCLNSRPDTL